MIKINKIAVGVITISILIGLSPVIADNTLLEENQVVYNSSAKIIDRPNKSAELDLGVDTDEGLHFGRSPLKSSVTKYVNISVARKSNMDIIVEGNVSEALEYEDNFYFSGKKMIPFKFNATESGYYEGQIGLKVSTAKNQMGERWLDIRQSFY